MIITLKLSRIPQKMEFNAYLSSSFSSSSCPHSTSTSPLTISSSVVSSRTFRELTVKAVLGNIISVVVCILFGIVGSLMGAIHGAIIGEISEQGYFCGASFGAVSGAFLSVEVSEIFLRLWLSDDKRIDSVLYLGDVLVSLVNGERVRERLGPVLMINPRQVHMRNGTETEASFEDMFETGGSKGLSGDRMQRIPMIEITSGDITDSYGERIPCSVCLEEFHVGEKARTLPRCNHMFHPSCIDQWLIKCGSCPLCRRNL